jgi:hypothetical protein
VSLMRVHQHHEIVSEARVFDARPLLLSSDRFRSLQHRVDLDEVDITEQGRKHAPYAKGNFQFERVIAGWREQSVLDLRRK